MFVLKSKKVGEFANFSKLIEQKKGNENYTLDY